MWQHVFAWNCQIFSFYTVCTKGSICIHEKKTCPASYQEGIALHILDPFANFKVSDSPGFVFATFFGSYLKAFSNKIFRLLNNCISTILT